MSPSCFCLSFVTSLACAVLLSSCETPSPSAFAGPGSHADYTVTYAQGYAGQGYYYGPANLSYYDQQPGIIFYRERAEVPRRYWVNAAVPGQRHHMRNVPPPRSTFVVAHADGYAGRGFYYGPPDLPYYDRGPGVMYFRTRAEVPGVYWQATVPASTTR